jgi:hypothetical protein
VHICGLCSASVVFYGRLYGAISWVVIYKEGDMKTQKHRVLPSTGSRDFDTIVLLKSYLALRFMVCPAEATSSIEA